MRKPLLSHDELVYPRCRNIFSGTYRSIASYLVPRPPIEGFAVKMERFRPMEPSRRFYTKEESLEDAAQRVVAGRTGLAPKYLHQFHAFGDPNRGKRNHGLSMKKQQVSWLEDRFVTIGYWSVVEFSKVIPTPDVLTSECRWWNLDQIPELILDHRTILDKALVSLRQYLNDFPLGTYCPNNSTMPELQRLYETILGKKPDRAIFKENYWDLMSLTRLAKKKNRWGAQGTLPV